MAEEVGMHCFLMCGSDLNVILTKLSLCSFNTGI